MAGLEDFLRAGFALQGPGRGRKMGEMGGEVASPPEQKTGFQ